jgi:hypothetical protein
VAVVGPGAIQENEISPLPTLEKASEFEYVTILNPLSDDFAVRVAQDIPVNMPMQIRAGTGAVQSEGDLLRTYGDTFKNPDFTGRKHIINDTVIKAGQTINLKGNEAQVAVRQLVNEILQREGKQRLMHDPHLRREVEDRIIKHRGSVQELMEQSLRSTQSQINTAIEQSNGVPDEQAFPGIEHANEGSGSIGTAQSNTPDDHPSERKRVGRPKKENS